MNVRRFQPEIALGPKANFMMSKYDIINRVKPHRFIRLVRLRKKVK